VPDLLKKTKEGTGPTMTDNPNNLRGADDPLAIAKDLLRRGVMPLPVPIGRKNPVIDEWQTLTITEANLDQYFTGVMFNVGGRMGHKSGGLTDIDLDCPEALTLWKYFLPSTPSRYGRASKPASHHLYRCDSNSVDQKGSIAFKDESKKTFLEIRIGGGTKGAQSIMPGSCHPSGEFYVWDEDGEPARIVYDDLKTAVTNLAIAALLLRHWPESGRNDIALGVGGFLARAGKSADTIFRIVRSVCLHRGAAERAEKHAQTAASCVEAYQAGRETRGYPWLEETFDANVAKALSKIVEYRTVQEPVAEDGRPAIKIEAGKLSVTADKAEEVLIAAGVQFYERSNGLVRPIIREVDAFRGRKTKAAQFARIDITYMRDALSRNASWHRRDKRANRWDPVDVPFDVAATVLARAGEWKFPTVAGIATAPTLRPDGSILNRPGYDPATQLLLVDSLDMPPIPEKPTKDDAVTGLKLITDLLEEFPFVDDAAKAPLPYRLSSRRSCAVPSWWRPCTWPTRRWPDQERATCSTLLPR
jgi:hypothetical protein